jgi:hypothetical protein
LAPHASREQAKALQARFEQCGGDEDLPPTFSISTDQNGRVVGATGLPSELTDCLLTVVQGLRFSCLAGVAISQEADVFLE